jgi:hypothetical protein
VQGWFADAGKQLALAVSRQHVAPAKYWHIPYAAGLSDIAKIVEQESNHSSRWARLFKSKLSCTAFTWIPRLDFDTKELPKKWSFFAKNGISAYSTRDA